jgi:hypothetical protein
MKQGSFLGILVLAMATAPLAALAQLPTAQLTSVFPPGGKQGTAVEVTLSGSDLDGAESLLFNHPGLSGAPKMSAVTSLEPARPLGGQFTVKIASDVPAGIYEVRAVGRFGLSNPRSFAVGAANEIVQPGGHSTPEKALEITSGTTINGRVDANSFEFLRINLKQGEQVLIDVAAKRIDSRLDAELVVLDAKGHELKRAKAAAYSDPMLDFTAPEAGSYLLKIYDSVYGGGDGYFYRLTVGAVPHVDFIFPPSGPAGSQNQYLLFGRNLPGGEPAPGISVGGVQLQRLPIIIPLPGDEASQSRLTLGGFAPLARAWQDGIEFRLSTATGPANPVSVYFSKSPTVVAEQEPNNDAEAAQRIALPCEIVGQFYPQSDVDWVQFDAKKDQTYWIEVISNQLGQPTDPFFALFRVTSDKGPAEVDDADERSRRIGDNFDTTSDDPAYKFVVPEDGTYRLMVRDQFGDSQKDPANVYRLAIRPSRPDFRLLAYPNPPPASQQQQNQTPLASTSVRRGGTAVVGLSLQRRDEFAGEITVSVEGLPPGVTCPGAVLGGKVEDGSLIFIAAEDASAWAGPVKIVGKAMIDDREVVREARYAVVVWGTPNRQQQAAAFRLAPTFQLGVIDKEVEPALVQVGEDKIYEAPLGGSIEIPIKMKRRGDFKDPVKLIAVGLGQQARPKEVTLDGDKGEGKFELQLNQQNLRQGTYTIYLRGETKRKYVRNPEAVAAAEAEQKRVGEMIKSIQDEIKSATEAKDEVLLKAAMDKLKDAEQLKQEADKRTGQAKEQNQAKDVQFSLVSTPIKLRILPSAKK